MITTSSVSGLRERTVGWFLGILIALAAGHARQLAGAEIPRALPEGKIPADQRLEPLKDLDGYFPFVPPATKEQWAKRAEVVRRRLLVTLGLWPMPSKQPLNAVIHGRIDRDDYSVEKAYFESVPGFYVTGNLYRPKRGEGKRPGVLCPHGHWSNGRFLDTGAAGVATEIEQGAERFEEGGRSVLQARCVHLARMGCVVFHYDMIGYADSVQIPSAISHGFAKQRPEMNSPEDWGLFSPQAESYYQSVMGLQTFSSIRALDFLTSLPDVDPERIGVTGASGGGTQTFILGAIDPRPTVAMPCVMVSTAMQGGCTCENACGLRVGTGNVEIAALFAPKPLGLTAANDWTKEMASKGFPELKQLFGLLGAADKTMLHSRLDFGHNYNAVSRMAMYKWFNRHLLLGLPEPVLEREYQRLTQQELSVWDSQHPKPEGGPDFERRLLRWWKEDADRQLAGLTPNETSSLSRFREIVGGAIDVVIGRGLPPTETLDFESKNTVQRGDQLWETGLLRNKSAGEEIPLLSMQPRKKGGTTVIWLHPEGKRGLLDEAGIPRPPIARLLAAGAEVIGVDLLYQGEFLADGKPIERTRQVKNPREAAAYTLGYNHALFAQRTHDVLSVISFLGKREPKPRFIDLVGFEGAGPWAAAARAQARNVIHRTAINTLAFRFAKVADIRHPDFLPGGAKYGDIPAMLAVGAPGELWLAGESSAPPLIAATYRAAGAANRITVFDGPKESAAETAVTWLLRD